MKHLQHAPHSLGLMVKSAPQERVSNHAAAPSFETRPSAAPQDEAEKGHIPSPEQFAIAMARALSNTLALSHLCLKRRCRRAGKCKGDPHDCVAVGETLLSPDIVEGAQLFLEGQFEGLSFDQAHARGPELMDAYANWIGRIKRKSAPRR